ncbi:MAG: minor capsid protein [Desulfovibrio sp.]|jgi:SPP1 gp7 family putative phage head morphogenesis protein|nr:minor capsid protein [Desulfovibrio sp.]
MADKPFSLAAAFGMAPRDAVAYFQSKGYATTFDWRDMWQDAHARAFTVASVARMDVLRDIRVALSTALQEGKTRDWFVKELTPILQKKGWWGPRFDVDPDGRARKVRQGSPARLELIYRQNVQGAYMAGRYKEQLADAENRPYWQYVAVLDQRTRPAHAANDGAVYPYDDPFWDVWYPPNGWGCRCRTRALSRRAMEREGREVQNSEGRMLEKTVETVNRDTGLVEDRTVSGVRTPGGLEVYTDAGFSYNPGAAAFGTDMELARRLSRVEDPKLYAEVVQSINNSPLRQEQFARDAARMLDNRTAGRGSLAVGLVDRDIVDFVREKGFEPATILVLPEKQLLHADRERHHRLGIALTRSQLLALPRMLSQPEAVLWDIRHNSVVYLYPDSNPNRCITIPAEMPAQKKITRYAPRLDAVVNAYTTDREIYRRAADYIRIR